MESVESSQLSTRFFMPSTCLNFILRIASKSVSQRSAKQMDEFVCAKCLADSIANCPDVTAFNVIAPSCREKGSVGWLTGSNGLRL
jgi:hypothetical protein